MKMKLLALAALAVVSSTGSLVAQAHTRLQTPTITGGVRTYNSVVVGHGCGTNRYDQNGKEIMAPVIATSAVFPDNTATVSYGTGQTDPNGGTQASDYISDLPALVQQVQSYHIFGVNEEHVDPQLGNTTGFWVTNGLIKTNLTAQIPFRTSGGTFPANSCAKSVKLVVAIADICRFTTLAGMNDATVGLWTPAVGSSFDGPGLHGYNSPATLTITRPATNTLPTQCGAGIDVTLTPTAAQINRDLPIPRVWPRAR